MTKNMHKLWWQTIFDEKYLATYLDIVTPKLTALQIKFLKRVLKKKSRVLDLACGYGRHTISLAASGYEMTGLDYSETFLRLARQEVAKQKLKVDFVKGDMRRFDFDYQFDAVISMFTSFGYFKSEADDLKVLKNYGGHLKASRMVLKAVG